MELDLGRAEPIELNDAVMAAIHLMEPLFLTQGGKVVATVEPAPQTRET